jgi:hypothetical protein
MSSDRLIVRVVIHASSGTPAKSGAAPGLRWNGEGPPHDCPYAALAACAPAGMAVPAPAAARIAPPRPPSAPCAARTGPRGGKPLPHCQRRRTPAPPHKP